MSMNRPSIIPINGLVTGSLLLVILILLLEMLFPSVFEVLELKTIDLRFSSRAMVSQRPEISSSVFHLNLDNYSYAQAGAYSWSRKRLGELTSRIEQAGAAILVYDFVFADYRDSLDDREFFKLFEEAGIGVLAYQARGHPVEYLRSELQREYPFDLIPLLRNSLSNHKNLPKSYGFGAIPVKELAKHALSAGFVNLKTDPDGVIRRYPLVLNSQGKLLPSIVLASLAAFLDADLESIQFYKNSILLPNVYLPDAPEPFDLSIPIDQKGFMIINYPGKLSKELYPNSYSAFDILQHANPAQLLSQFGNKLGILSDVSDAGKDFCTTPYDANFPSSFLYSTIISNILNQQFVYPVNSAFKYLLICVFASGIIVVSTRFRISIHILTGLLLVLGYLILNFYLFISWGYLLPLLSIMIPVLSVLLYSTLYKFYYEDRYNRRLREGLRSYLSPPLLAQMETNPDFLRPGGTRKKISILFSDIVGFTAFCDTADTDEVQAILSEYLEKMVAIVFKHNGIIDKYLGDGLLAFFEENESDKPIQVRAVLTALEMQLAAKQLALGWKTDGRLDLKIRIGVATGIVAVGNLGPSDKIDYTIIGKKVNLAQRLESAATPTQVYIDEETKSGIDGTIESEFVGELELKGFSDKVAAYRPL